MDNFKNHLLVLNEIEHATPEKRQQMIDSTGRIIKEIKKSPNKITPDLKREQRYAINLIKNN